jgi:C4-type Zn-finger protein
MKTIKKERVRCSRCKETLLTTDDGWATPFLKKDIGKTIVCIKRPHPQGSLHFWDRMILII